jgi:hypothetical protein
MGTAEGGGNISLGDAVGFTIGTVKFTLVVADGKVAEGSMDSGGSASSDVPGAQTGLDFVFEGELSGDSTNVNWVGIQTFEGNVATELLTVPISGGGPAYGEFKPLTATCSRVTGDFAAYGRGLQKAAGAATSVKANFVAIRDTSTEAEPILEEYTNIAGEITAATILTGGLGTKQSGPGGLAALPGLLDDVSALLKHINSLQACGAAPPGFEKGLADPHFSDLFRELIDAILANADELDTSQLVEILWAAFQTGAVGKTSPDPAAAEETLGQLLDLLFARVDEHAQEGDDAALLEIYLAAQQLGLKDLAAHDEEKLN